MNWADSRNQVGAVSCSPGQPLPPESAVNASLRKLEDVAAHIAEQLDSLSGILLPVLSCAKSVAPDASKMATPPSVCPLHGQTMALEYKFGCLSDRLASIIGDLRI